MRTALLVTSVLLVTGIVAAVVVAITRVTDASARTELVRDLSRSEDVFHDLSEYRRSLLATNARVLAEEPRLKAVVATSDITHETIVGVARELQRSAELDLLLLADADGTLLADVLDPDAHGHDVSSLPVVREALRTGHGGTVWTDDRGAYDVQAARIAFGETVVGVVVVGLSLDDRVAQTLHRQTGSRMGVLLDGSVIASSLPDGVGARDLQSFEADGPTEVVLAGVRYMATAAPLEGYEGDRTLEYVIVHSLDEALAPARRLRNVILWIAAVGLVVAFLMIVLLSRRLARPFDELVRFTERVGAGELDATAPATGFDETRALGSAMNRMVGELAESRRQIATKERLEKEMEIASQIQTSVLPRTLDAEGLEIAARMVPASEVGGDYYELLPVEDGACWIGIGDVAGHGMPAGVVMLMIQTAVATFVRERPGATPADLIASINHVLFHNVRDRLRSDEHVTLCLLRHDGRGRIAFAGAHEEMVVFRAAASRAELIETPGTWIGFAEDISEMTMNGELELGVGDVLVVFTDGVTEAMNAGGEQFGIERLVEEVEARAGDSPEVMCDAILDRVAAWTDVQADDVTLMVVRRTDDA